jgi:hypothetical protein
MCVEWNEQDVVNNDTWADICSKYTATDALHCTCAATVAQYTISEIIGFIVIGVVFFLLLVIVLGMNYYKGYFECHYVGKRRRRDAGVTYDEQSSDESTELQSGV